MNNQKFRGQRERAINFSRNMVPNVGNEDIQLRPGLIYLLVKCFMLC